VRVHEEAQLRPPGLIVGMKKTLRTLLERDGVGRNDWINLEVRRVKVFGNDMGQFWMPIVNVRISFFQGQDRFAKLIENYELRSRIFFFFFRVYVEDFHHSLPPFYFSLVIF